MLGCLGGAGPIAAHIIQSSQFPCIRTTYFISVTVVFDFSALPSAITVYNIKCEKVASLGTGPWNQISFNPHGSLLLAGGFGSLNGSCAVWSFKKGKRLSEFSAQNSTYLSWLADGEHIVTAITTPRLRIDNGYVLRKPHTSFL